MLAVLGNVVFDLRTDLASVDSEETSSFAAHDVMGAAPIYEDTGDEEATVTLQGTLYPHFFAGSLAGISLLKQARRAKLPLPLMRGDFTPMGWFLIKSISDSATELDAGDGVGHVVEYTVSLIKVGTPGVSQAPSILRLLL